ncbi:MAG: siderophore ABC transporter substrate-binding protein [Tissierellaceae bacterium]|nr:siderophore ABC transporter substrate-binding protein [Tissierellaceae bacterium]
MKIKRLSILIVIMAISVFLIAGCDSFVDESSGQDIEMETVNIVHELGEVIVNKEPNRVIVFDYGILDALDTIGEEIIGLPKSSLPEYLGKYREDKYIDVGTLQEPNFETIYELSPDLIIISARQSSLYDEFMKIAPTVYLNVDGGDYINSFKNNMSILGTIFDRENELEKIVNDIEISIEELKDAAGKKDIKSLFIMANDGNLSAFGKGSRFGVIHNEFGLAPIDEGIEVSTHGQKITFEYILEKNPDYIFVMDRAVVVGGDISAKQVMDNELIHSTKAYKNDNIIYLDAYIWYVSSGGITGTERMVEEINSAIRK